MHQLLAAPQRAKALLYTENCPTEDFNRYFKQVQNESYRAFLDMLLLNLPRPSKVPRHLPVWVVGGETDVLFPPKVVRRTAKAYNTTATIYPNMAHSSLLLENGWQQVAADLHQWLQQRFA